MKILDPYGRPLRRSIGFHQRLEREPDVIGEISVSACGFHTPVNEDFEGVENSDTQQEREQK